MSELEEFRRAKDDFFRDHPASPLTPEQREQFTGLDYLPENPDLVVRARLDADVDPTPFVMPTTTGDEQEHRRVGRIRFEVDGQPAELTLYASDVMEELFLPFRDATSGKETYGAGRYLEVDPPDDDGMVVVDFNRAYNPYCAYNERWSCPLPPTENWLQVPIRAGERNFPGTPAS